MKTTIFYNGEEGGFTFTLDREDLARELLCEAEDISVELLYEVVKALADDFLYNDASDELEFLLEIDNVSESLYDRLEASTSALFWECNCPDGTPEGFIHMKKEEGQCPRCLATLADSPDAQILSLINNPRRTEFEDKIRKFNEQDSR